MKRQQGFTLIELVMVIVILAILAAIAMPKFVNLKGDAQTAALAGVAASLNSAVAMNYAIRGLNPNSGVSTIAANGVNHSCTTVFIKLIEGGLPAQYVTGSDTANNAGVGALNIAGKVQNCLVSADGITSMVVPITAIN